MARSSDVRDRLQPALLDRLTDDAPHERTEADEHRAMSKAQLRAALLRDLSWLFNAVQPMPRKVAEQFPQAAESVLNFGLPAMSGELASRLDIDLIERTIKQAIVRFEPRILPDSIEVKALEASSVLDTHNVIEFEIRGVMWAQPVPLEMLLRTQVDLEAGQVQVREAGSGAVKGR